MNKWSAKIKIFFDTLHKKTFELFLNEQNITLPQLFKSKNRNFEHFLSRYALALLYQSGSDLSTELSFLEIELKDYQFLNDDNSSCYSLAHTKEMAVAVKALKEHFTGIGCDVEYAQRKMPAGSERHFLNDKDQIKLPLLESWCVKEACFKALSNSGEDIQLLKDVIIHDHKFYYSENPNSNSALNKFELFYQDEYIVVIAYCAKKEDKLELKEVIPKLR